MRLALSFLVVTLTACGAPETSPAHSPESSCMRTLSSQESALLTLQHYGTWARVDVDRNGAGVWVDLTTLSGVNWVVGVDRSGSIDNPVDTLTVTLAREVGPLSLSPLVQTSPLNTYLGSYVPMLDTGRRIRAYEAMAPLGAAPQSSDWRLVFDGYIDPVDAGGEGAITIQARDLGARLQDTFIETIRTYGSGAGIAAETVMQSILDDNLGVGVVTLYVPVSPAFAILTYKQAKEPVMDALRKIAQNFGWEVGYRWRAGTAQFELTLFGPDRAKVVPDRTVYPDEVHKYGKAAIDRTNVRNAVRVIWGPTDNRTTYLTTDATSITRYGRRYMEVAEAASSQIDTVGEATTMANAILSDLKDPVLEAEPEVNGFWAVELGDLWRLKAGTYADGPVFSTDQDLAVRTYRSSIRGDGVGTLTVGVGGKPSAGYRRWLEMQGRPGVAPATDTTTPTTPANPVAIAGIGSIEITYDQPTDVDWDYSECHVSTVNGFTPDATSLVDAGHVTKFTVGGLIPGVTYYAKIVAVSTAGNRSLISAQVSVATATVGPAAMNWGVDQSQNMLPNPNLCVFTAPATPVSAPPDGWETVVNRTPTALWGSAVASSTTTQSADRSVQITYSAGTGGYQGVATKSLLPAVEGELYAAFALYKVGAATAFAQVAVDFYTAAGAYISTGSSANNKTTWSWLRLWKRAPATARWAKVTATGIGNNGDTILFDSLGLYRAISRIEVTGNAGAAVGPGAYTQVGFTIIGSMGEEWSAVNNRYTVAPGDDGREFLFTGSVVLASVASGKIVRAALFKNGVAWREGGGATADGINDTPAAVAGSGFLAAGDIIDLRVWNGDTVNRNIVNTPSRVFMAGGVNNR